MGAELNQLQQGSTQISSVDAEGRNYIATVVSGLLKVLEIYSQRSIQHPGDLWYFPPGIPHALQATADSPDGSEFILVRVEPLHAISAYTNPLLRSLMTVLLARTPLSW